MQLPLMSACPAVHLIQSRFLQQEQAKFDDPSPTPYENEIIWLFAILRPRQWPLSVRRKWMSVNFVRECMGFIGGGGGFEKPLPHPLWKWNKLVVCHFETSPMATEYTQKMNVGELSCRRMHVGELSCWWTVDCRFDLGTFTFLEWESDITAIFATVLLPTAQTIGKITLKAATINDWGSYIMILSRVGPG